MSARHTHGAAPQGERAHQHEQQQERQPRPPLRVETFLFGGLIVYFAPVTLIYGLWSGWEPVGVVALGLCAGLYAMVTGYLWITSRRVDPRAEDDPLGEVNEGAGEVGVFAPHSWWPFVLGIAAAIAFLGLAVGWWIFGIGVVVAIIGLVGLLFEFSRGQHAH